MYFSVKAASHTSLRSSFHSMACKLGAAVSHAVNNRAAKFQKMSRVKL